MHFQVVEITLDVALAPKGFLPIITFRYLFGSWLFLYYFMGIQLYGMGAVDGDLGHVNGH
jgi:hypothetical protein